MLPVIKPKSRVIRSAEREGDELILRADHGTLCLTPKSADIVRITYTPEGSGPDGMFRMKERPGVVCGETFADWSFRESDDLIEMKLPGITAVVARQSGAVSFVGKDGKCLFAERSSEPKEFEAFETYRLADAPQRTRVVQTADGAKEILEDPEKIPTGKAYHVRLCFTPGDEALYGLGQQEKGFASLRGRTLYVHQANRKIAVPMFVSTAGYGVLTDTYSPFIFHDDADGAYLYLEADSELTYYFIAGAMNEVIAGYRFLTGKAALLPKWAYGFVQSQERYESQEEILRTVEKSRELGIGMDCIVQDWFTWPDNAWGQKSYDRSRYPDPAGMISKLHESHVHYMISIWPSMAEGTPDHEEMAAKGLLLPACTVYDAFRKEARELYFEQLSRTHLSYGTDAWWCDSSEPFTPEWSHLMRMEESTIFREYCDEAGLRMSLPYANAFPLYHAMGIYEGQRKAMKELPAAEQKRVCNLTRSAYTGQQRYGTILWSGDTAASWETFRDQIPIGLHLCASGLPYWTTDVGAFFVKRGLNWYWDGHYDDATDNKGYCELYTRWYQFAAFLPMFRAHGTDCRRELWSFTGEFYDALLAANRLRYSLMPYIYSEAGKVWLEDRSLIRFLSFDFPEDRNTWEIVDQFLFGESLMICPVVKPMYYGEDGEALEGEPKSREVYLPKGCDWYDFETGRKYDGGSTVTVDAPLDCIPVFVKDGSIIPMRKPARSTEEQTDTAVYRRFGEKARYEMYDDVGDGYAYERGEYTLLQIE